MSGMQGRRKQPEADFQQQVFAYLASALDGDSWFSAIPLGGGGAVRGAALETYRDQERVSPMSLPERRESRLAGAEEPPGAIVGCPALLPRVPAAGRLLRHRLQEFGSGRGRLVGGRLPAKSEDNPMSYIEEPHEPRRLAGRRLGGGNHPVAGLCPHPR